MEAVFKKSIRNWRFYVFACCSLIVFGLDLLGQSSIPRTIVFLLLWLPFLMIFVGSYKITDDDILEGNGKVPVKSIRKLVRQPDSIVVYYQPDKGEKLLVKPYYVEDKELFVEKLKEINPDIQEI